MVNPGCGTRNYTPADPGLRRVELVVPLDLAGLRLDRALAQLVPELSRSRLARLIAEGHVRVDGAAAEVRRKVGSGERVEIWLAPRSEEQRDAAEPIGLAPVFEDDEILVLDKPAGLVVHPGAGNRTGTLLNALLHHAPGLCRLPRAGIVHRLDKETSGLLVVAKTERAQRDLAGQLLERSVKRTYLAVVRGRLGKGGTVDAPIGRHPVRRTRMAVVARGRPAVTHFRIREAFAAHTLLECELETGRTHQIRVHLASIGHAIEGDPEYAGRGPKRLGRQALHAWRLAFRHPGSGAAVRYEAEPPQDFAALLEALRAA